MQRTCETIRLVAGSKQTYGRIGWQVWQMFQRETKPSGTDDTIWRARTSMANCWLRYIWVEWFVLYTRCWLRVGIGQNREIEQHFFSLDREQFEIHICKAWNSRNCRHRQWFAVLVTDVHCICWCSWIHSQNKQSKISAIKRELWRQSRVSWRRARTSMKHFLRTGQLPWATATVQLRYWWGESFERPSRLYHHRWILSGHISKMQGRHSVKISSVKRKRLINVTGWSTCDLWIQVNMSGWNTWIIVGQWRRTWRFRHDRTWWRRNTVMCDAIVVTWIWLQWHQHTMRFQHTLTFQSTWMEERKNWWLSQQHPRENLNHLSRDVTLRERNMPAYLRDYNVTK